MISERTIEDVVETLRATKERERACSILIGAGCSVEAGIPTADGFVETIRKKYPLAYERAVKKAHANNAVEKIYAYCMAQLAWQERRELITRFVDRAKINWAHIAIAQLMEAGYVDRVLTTNFDLLVTRACSLLGLFPAVYDFAASQEYRPEDIPQRAIFYLHGQYTGFIVLNTSDEFEKLSKVISPVLEDAGRLRPWIVVGYSGKNDPVFEQITKIPRFDCHLYWVGFKKTNPGKHLREKLLETKKDAHYVSGFDADGFFVRLAYKLGCFPPTLVDRPFSHLDDLLKNVAAFTLPLEAQTNPLEAEQTNPLDDAREKIKQAINQHEVSYETGGGLTDPDSQDNLARKARSFFMAGEYDKVVALQPEDDNALSSELTDLLAWAHLMQGNLLASQATTKSREESDHLFEKAYKKYQSAIEIKPDMHDALNNWGNALAHHAEIKSGEDANKLFKQAYNKYEDALQISPQEHDLLNNWGYALYRQAKSFSGNRAASLYVEAGKKYDAALQIKPDKEQALVNWGIALAECASLYAGEKADKLFSHATKRCEAALRYQPGDRRALNEWGKILVKQAEQKAGIEVNKLLEVACQKYDTIIRDRPDDYDALCNWASALLIWAQKKTGKERKRLLDEAAEKADKAEYLKAGSGAQILSKITVLRQED